MKSTLRLAVCVALALAAATAVADTPEVYKAHDIEEHHAAPIQEYHADTIEVFTARTIEPYVAQQVQAYIGHIADDFCSDSSGITPFVSQPVKVYKAQPVHKLTRKELDAMLRNDMRGYERSKSSHKGASGGGGLTQAQIDAYGALNHNIGVWYSGNPFTY